MLEEKAIDVLGDLAKTATRCLKDDTYKKEVSKIQEIITKRETRITYEYLVENSKLSLSEVVDLCTLLESRGAIRVIQDDSKEFTDIRVIDKYKFL